MKTKCKYAKQISPFIDGELPARDAGRIRRHLASCDHCRGIYERFRAMDEQMTRMPSIEPSDGFDRAFWRKFDARENEKRWWSRWDLSSAWQPALAAAAAIILFAGLLLYDRAPDGNGLTAEDVVIAENLELLEDYDLVRHLDLLEEWEGRTDA